MSAVCASKKQVSSWHFRMFFRSRNIKGRAVKSLEILVHRAPCSKVSPLFLVSFPVSIFLQPVSSTPFSFVNFSHQHRGHVALPNSESALPDWDPSCCTAPSERCPGGSVTTEGGSPRRSSKCLCRSLSPPHWRSAFRRGRGGDE